MSVRQRPGAGRPANPPARGAESAPVTWLTAAELDSWLSLVRLMIWLPWCIDQQLRRDSDLAIVEYQVLAMLSQAPGTGTMRMSSLAEVTNASLVHPYRQTEAEDNILGCRTCSGAWSRRGYMRAVHSIEPYTAERLDQLVATRLERQAVIKHAYLTAVIEQHISIG